MKQLIKICCLSFVFLLSGCTILFWFKHPATKTYTDSQQVTDTIRAFGKTQERNRERVVMMGDQYWFFIDADKTPELLKLLNTKLPKAFNTPSNKPFEIKLHKNIQTFESAFSLYYLPQNEREESILKELGFRLDEKNKSYKKDYLLDGEIYRANKKIHQDYQFETALPVSITIMTKTSGIDYLKLIRNIAVTPFAFATDLILLPTLAIIENVN